VDGNEFLKKQVSECDEFFGHRRRSDSGYSVENHRMLGVQTLCAPLDRGMQERRLH
jgi:hypothetical protein